MLLSQQTLGLFGLNFSTHRTLCTSGAEETCWALGMALGPILTGWISDVAESPSCDEACGLRRISGHRWARSFDEFRQGKNHVVFSACVKAPLTLMLAKFGGGTCGNLGVSDHRNMGVSPAVCGICTTRMVHPSLAKGTENTVVAVHQLQKKPGEGRSKDIVQNISVYNKGGGQPSHLLLQESPAALRHPGSLPPQRHMVRPRRVRCAGHGRAASEGRRGAGAGDAGGASGKTVGGRAAGAEMNGAFF